MMARQLTTCAVSDLCFRDTLRVDSRLPAVTVTVAKRSLRLRLSGQLMVTSLVPEPDVGEIVS